MSAAVLTPPRRADSRWSVLAGLLVILAAAVATRAYQLGNPAVHMDEQLYLLVGDRMWRGALPYVDIWDRKPIGLFLIYAAARPFSPDGVLAYQLAALACATVTAAIVTRIARRVAGPAGAAASGLIYLVFLPVLGGAGGQSPVFYNLLTALAGLCVLKAREARDARASMTLGLGAMLLVGLAMQVKYTVAVEGVGFGLWLIAAEWRRSGGSGARVALAVAAWMATALLPTVLAAAAYALLGHGREFIQANFISIFQEHEPAGYPSGVNLMWVGYLLAPLMLISLGAVLRLTRGEARSSAGAFLCMWSAFAVLEFFALGHFYTHYALPLLVPLSTACAAVLTGWPTAAAAVAALSVWSASLTGFPSPAGPHATRRTVQALAAAVAPYAARGCVYVNDGPDAVYLLSRSCLPTPYVFPEHLNNAAESRATDAPAAMHRLLQGRPSAILVADRRLDHARNRVTAAMLDRALAASYRFKASLPDVVPGRRQLIYVRRDLP